MATYPVNDWQYEVANGDTRLGYAEWAANKVEADADGDQVEAEPWRVRLTYHVTQYRVAEVEIPRAAAGDERAAAEAAMQMVRDNPELAKVDEITSDTPCCDVEVDNFDWRDESGAYGI